MSISIIRLAMDGTICMACEQDSHYPRCVPAKFHAAPPPDEDAVEVKEMEEMNWQEILNFVNNTDFQ